MIKFKLPSFIHSSIQTLLDESTSTVVCASQLLPEEVSEMPSQGSATGSTTTGGIGSMMGGVVGGKLFEASGSSSWTEEGVVIFVTHQAALVVREISYKIDFASNQSHVNIIMLMMC